MNIILINALAAGFSSCAGCFVSQWRIKPLCTGRRTSLRLLCRLLSFRSFRFLLRFLFLVFTHAFFLFFSIFISLLPQKVALKRLLVCGILDSDLGYRNKPSRWASSVLPFTLLIPPTQISTLSSHNFPNHSLLPV